MAKVDRRTFLKTAGVSVGALALAGEAVSGSRLASAALTQTPTRPRNAPEVVVIGAGAFGGWTALYLRERNVSVTMVDAYGPGNARASSGGENRQIRAGYGERELYTRWVLQAFKRWKARQAEWGRTLFFQTGQLQLARELTGQMRATRGVFDRLGVAYRVLTHDDLVREYPQLEAGDIGIGFYTPSTGVLKAREGCQAVADAFERSGGRFVMATAAPGRRTGRSLQDVTLSTGERLSAQTFVFACGPWLPKLFPEVMQDKLRTPRRVEFFFGTPPNDERFSYPNFPNWSVGGVYGFPSIEGRGFKVAPRAIDNIFVDPDTQERVVTPAEVAYARQFVERRFPALADQPVVLTKVCQYENSVDSHMIVTLHPEFDNVWLVGGGSGHGYKHGIILGEYVTNRVLGHDEDAELEATFKLKAETF